MRCLSSAESHVEEKSEHCDRGMSQSDGKNWCGERPRFPTMFPSPVSFSKKRKESFMTGERALGRRGVGQEKRGMDAA